MALHPILALDHVLDEYRDYLRTEFRAKDPALKAALERELDQPLFLAQEPFFQAHRPFKNGKKWSELPLDPKLARVMAERARKHGSISADCAFLHQSEAILNLLSENPSPLVVTTGTGSGKTECFLLPVIQNAIEDATRYKKDGLTAILVYPMNALANDQLGRIEEYLRDSGFGGTVSVAKYDRGTSQAEREELRKNPPHILLTNYMMLEYLLVRPADRDGIFANHRCKFLVLDEVHTYRGTLGTNIAFLIRRLKAHLENARQDWHPHVSSEEKRYRYPKLLPIGTSATIKSVAEEGKSREEIVRLRDEAVQAFFSPLVGIEKESIKVLGEEIQDITIPTEAAYPATPKAPHLGEESIDDLEKVREALCELAGQAESTSLAEAASCCRILWDLNHWLIYAPLSVSQIVDKVQAEVPERKIIDREQIRKEVESALVIGAALPEGTPGALRLRVHRLIRGGWRFHRSLNPADGKLFPMGEEQDETGYPTAPLYLCRNCGADYMRFVGDPETGPLRPSAVHDDGPEWMLYEHERFEGVEEDIEELEDEEEVSPPRRRGRQQPKQVKGKPILKGSFDPKGLLFSPVEDDYPMKVTLVPARTKCLCCGGSAGSRNVISPVALGTSAAVKVLSEGMVEALDSAHSEGRDPDRKERLLIFSDSRQDAAHQARFISFASRYDRMRRRCYEIIEEYGRLPIQRIVELLGDRAVQEKDNPHVPEGRAWLTDEDKNRIRAWEEAPLLDDISTTAGYRATIVNVGLVGVRYSHLDEYVEAMGDSQAGEWGINKKHMEHICRCILDEIRVRSCLSRDMLRYNPLHSAYPQHFKLADWERRIKQPQAFAADTNGNPLPYIESNEVPQGIKVQNAWRKPKTGGKGPGPQRIVEHLLAAIGGIEPTPETMVAMLAFLKDGGFLQAAELFGARDRGRFLQVNADAIQLELCSEETRFRCNICGEVKPFSAKGLSCPKCHGSMDQWIDRDVNESRTVRRIKSKQIIPLIAGEHTAQIPHDVRLELEERFKRGSGDSKVNVLACSPTLEMGIDVGGLDAVVLRNVPPRPDNYAQRGGRAGRRSRVGLVLGYARSTPHDQYFYDKPGEMISGEVPAPASSLGNRDVLLRHIQAIAFGAAEPGLTGKMVEYISPKGELKTEAIDGLIEAVMAQTGHAFEIASRAFGKEVFEEAGFSDEALRSHMDGLPDRISRVFQTTARQVQELRQPLNIHFEELTGQRSASHAANLVARLLGIPSEKGRNRTEADDRSAGYPLRRFAEFGILPGYEFPTEPATLRLLNEEHEEDPLTVNRQFGIGQFQPDATVYARRKRWKVIGLDSASPWNPQSEGPTRTYRVCGTCELRFDATHPRCPRCKDDSPGKSLPAFEFGGFIARTDENPILDEEDRYATKNRVAVYPQWDGDTVGRWSTESGWTLRLSKHEEVFWLNEGAEPSPKDFDEGAPRLHQTAMGYYLCPSCGRLLTHINSDRARGSGRTQARIESDRQDPYGHGRDCPERGTTPRPLAIATCQKAETLRLTLPVAVATTREQVEPFGVSLGFSLQTGFKHLHMLDGGEIDFVLEGPWKAKVEGREIGVVSLTFVDGSLGGTGYLKRVAEDLHLIARRALQHLDHPNCETACYRCLKSYNNQRFHEVLSWPLAHPYLEALASSQPVQKPLTSGDIDDAGPWLEAYAAGVGSPLELKFLKLFEEHGFHPEKQVPIALQDGEKPITVADFAVPENRLAIYIDGGTYHVGQNLRRDRFIRDRLRQSNHPWRVEEFRASDLAAGRAILDRLSD